MRKFSIFLLLFCWHFNGLQAQQIYPNLTGEDLLDAVANDYKPQYVLDYGEARDVMYGEIYNVNDTVYCVYTGHSLYLPSNVDPSSHLYMNASSNGINAEHTYPQSKGADEDNGNAHSDLHHLFPVRTGVNTARSNFPFAEILDTQTDTWYFKTQIQNSIPSTNKQAYSERRNGYFEPREDHKGNVARAIFYFYTMYKAEALAADPQFFELQRETLCDWHLADPADALEIDRTYSIAGYQDDLPNPFVIDPSLAGRAYCNQGAVSTTPELEEIETEISIFPNPVSDILTVEMLGRHNLVLRDVLGRKLQDIHFDNQVQLDFSTLNNGIYFIQVEGMISKVMK